VGAWLFGYSFRAEAGRPTRRAKSMPPSLSLARSLALSLPISHSGTAFGQSQGAAGVPSRSLSLSREAGAARWPIQGYLAHQKQRPPGTLQYDYAQGTMVVLGGSAVSYERGTPATRAEPATHRPHDTTGTRYLSHRTTTPSRSLQYM